MRYEISELFNDYMAIPSHVTHVDWDRVEEIRLRLQDTITKVKKDNWADCTKEEIVILCSMNQSLHAFPFHNLFQPIKREAHA